MLHQIVKQLVPYVIVLGIMGPFLIFSWQFFDRTIPIDTRTYRFEVTYDAEDKELDYVLNWIGIRKDCEWDVVEEITGDQLLFMPRVGFSAVLSGSQVKNFSRPAPFLGPGEYRIVASMLFWCNDVQRAFNNPIRFISPVVEFTVPQE